MLIFGLGLVLALAPVGDVNTAPSVDWVVSLNSLQIYGTDSFSVSEVAIASDGNLMIKDNKESRLAFTDADGKLIKYYGQRGMGPGEFYMVDGIGWVESQKAFFATDRGTLRVSKFTSKGEFVDAFTTGLMRGPVFGDKDRLFFMRRVGSGSKYANALVSFSMSDKKDEEIFSAKMEQIPTIMIWHGQLTYDVGSNFVAVSHSDSGEVHILNPTTGKSMSKWPLNVPRIPITKEFLDPYMKDFMGRVFSKGRPPSGFKVDHREEWPYLHCLKIDREDRVWVFMHRLTDETLTPYRVFDLKGKVIKNGRLKGRPQTFTKEHLYVIDMNDDDTRLLRYKLKNIL